MQGLGLRLRQGAATAYCDSLGLGNATNYAIDANIGTNAICNTIVCNGFQSITCLAK